MSTAALTATESRLLALYRPIRAHLWGWERSWIDEVLVDGCEGELVDAMRYCRDRIEEIQHGNAEKEA